MTVKEFINSMEIGEKLLLNCWKGKKQVKSSQNLYTQIEKVTLVNGVYVLTLR